MLSHLMFSKPSEECLAWHENWVNGKVSKYTQESRKFSGCKSWDHCVSVISFRLPDLMGKRLNMRLRVGLLRAGSLFLTQPILCIFSQVFIYSEVNM